MFDEEVKGVLKKLDGLEKMYEIIRFVDPVAKKVISYKNNIINELEINCFDFWENNEICDNCISIRAYNDNKSYVKLEYSPNKVFLITAIPYELEKRKIIIELLKDITNSMVFGSGEFDNNSQVYAMINCLNNLILKDPLTDVYNRRYIDEKLPIDLLNTALTEQDISVIMADIDFFKKVNDTYGHLTGDEVLKSFANIISGCTQNNNDWVSRLGGEEFLICLPGAKLEKAVEIAEKMRMQVEASEIKTNNNIIKITASFGVNTMKPLQGSNMESFIEYADKKLYLAKNNGRNRVEY